MSSPFEFEAFIGQLAHELCTPLGQIETIATLLLERPDDIDDVRRWLEIQLGVTRQVEQTLRCLLDLGRRQRAPLQLQQIDLSALCERLKAELPDTQRRASVAWQIAPGLSVNGCPAQVAVMMRNLLANAAKYTRESQAPTITVSAASAHVTVVEDNGVGFDEAQAKRLFQPFVRLHAGTRFEGTGLGLSIVRSIIDRHGGWIRARGVPGAGARFEFSLS
jgi:signal transduction histidine kinase